MYILLPSQSLPAAIQLTTKASLYVRQAQSCLSADDEAPLQETILNITSSNLDGLQACLTRLESPLKKAWFPKVAQRPLFYDNAFNYIDLPLNELEMKAGKQPSAPLTPPPSSANTVLDKIIPQVVKAPIVSAVHTVQHAVQDTIHKVEEERMEVDAKDQEDNGEDANAKASGWFGGIWGRK